MKENKPVVGIVGAGKLGITIGNLALNAGYPLYISSRKSVKQIALTIEVLVPGATPTTTEEIPKLADIIILALPLSKYRDIDPNLFKDKIVIDAMNYWWEVDGVYNIYSDEQQSSSQRVASYFNTSRVIKAFNHIGYHDLTDYASAKTSANRKAMAFACDDKEAKLIVSRLIDDFGFIPRDIGNLENGRILEPGLPSFGALLTAIELDKIVDESLNKD